MFVLVSFVEGVDGDLPRRNRCLNDDLVSLSSGGGEVLDEPETPCTWMVGVGSYLGNAISSSGPLDELTTGLFVLLNLKKLLSRWGKVISLGVSLPEAAESSLGPRVSAADADVDRFRLNTSSTIFVCLGVSSWGGRAVQ